MPIIRYQIRNEYGLADPELYGAADKEDPEALLEGVAMAGLVGVLRQLGDLAEFAAEIFHNLHEEVMATAARGHALMLRVQQLEVDFPAIERGFLFQTSQSQLSCSSGTDWHPNVQIDENLITREDMPRFILDSYEESRGPPRLFMLDKFDIAGDGACLKRYSNPSFFKMDFAASGKMEPDMQREKRSRKNKKKVPRWRNGGTPEFTYTPHVNPKLENAGSEKAPENPPVKRVKLKLRQLNDSTSIRRSYIEHVVGMQSPGYTDFSENSISHSQVSMKATDSTELAPDIREVIMDTSIDRPFFRERNRIKPCNKEELSVTWKEETLSDMRDNRNEKKGLLQKATGEVERLPPTFSKDQKELLFDADHKREDNDDAESRTNGSLDAYRSDDAASELDNYLDALTTMDSEIDTDNEARAKPIPSFFSKECNKLDSNANEEKEFLNEYLGSHVFRASSAQHSLPNDRESRPPNEDSSNSVTDSAFHGSSRVLPVMFIDPEIPTDETHATNSENKANSEHLRKESSIDSVPNQVTIDVPIPLSVLGVESSTSCITDTVTAHSLRASPEDIQSASINQKTSSNNLDTIGNNNVCFDGGYSPPVNSEVTHVMMSNQTGGHADIDRLLEDDFHQRSDESKIPSINLGLTSGKPENFSNALVQRGDEMDMNLPVQDEPSVMVMCTEEPSAEGILSTASVSDPSQLTKATNLEVTSPMSAEDSSLPLSMFNGELHGPVCQEPEVDLGENTLTRKCTPVIPLDNSSSMLIPGGLLGTIDSSVSFDENFEGARSLTGPKDGTDFSENKVTCPEDTGNFAENEILASGILLPGPSFDTKAPQKSYNLDKVEITQKTELPTLLNIPPNVSYDETKDSFLVYDRRDSMSPTGNQLDLHNGIIPSSSPMELPHPESCSPRLVIECTEADELFSGNVHSKESSSNNVNQEDHSSCDSVSDQQELEVTEAPCPKDSVDLDLEQIPDAAASQEEYVLAAGHVDSVPPGNILDSSSGPECGDHNHACHTEPFELAQENLEPAVSNRAATSSAEVEHGKPKNPILQNGPDFLVSNMDDYLGNIEASNSEDLTGVHEHQASNIALPLDEGSDAVSNPGDSKSAEPVHDSCDHMGMKPFIIPSEEEHKMIISPWNTRSDEMLLESFDASDIGQVKHAKVNMHLLEVTEDIEYPVENQQVSHSKPFASSKHCQTANGYVFLSDDAITESISPSKEAVCSQSSDESDEISLIQKLGILSLSGTQFEREQPHEQDDNSMETHGQPSVAEAAEDSVDAISSGMIYQPDITSADASSFNQLETEADSPLQSSKGIPVTHAISSASLATLQTLPTLSASDTGMNKHQSSEIPLDADPPLPPLPPLQWRMGKLRPSSIMTNGEMSRPQSETNNSTTIPCVDHLGGSRVSSGAAMQPSNTFLQEQMHLSDSDQFGYLTLEEESMDTFQSCALPPAMEDQKCLDDVFASDVQMKDLPVNSSPVVSHDEYDQQRHELCQEALFGEMPQLLDAFTSPLELSDVRSQHFHRISEGESIEPPKSSASQPTSAHTEYLHGTENLETAAVHPSNPFLSSASTEGECHSYGVFGDRTVEHLNCPDSLSTEETTLDGFLISEGNMQAFALPTAEHDRPNGRPRSLLNRPRDPLIEAVASHDKSTLRRVSELVRPSARPEGERNTLLEQIRNKSFNLKPAAVAKPNIKGPPTNLKVAAILERAIAIRQAFVGSDEDDDEDGWSDS